MTVSRAAAQRVNEVVTSHLFKDQAPLSNVPLTSAGEGQELFPCKGMKVVITENRNKSNRIVNNQHARIINAHKCTLVVEFPEGQRALVYPVTRTEENGQNTTRYPCSLSYGTTISKSQGQNLKHLVLWLDCPTVPAGLAYVALSRIRTKADLSLLQPMERHQVVPVQFENL